MKKIIHTLTFLGLTVASLAQAPQKVSFQAVIRNSSNALVVSSTVSILISITKDSANGSIVYNELQKTTTSAAGLVSFAIGTGSAVTGSFSTINWGKGSYYMKTSTDPNGGTNYTIVGSSQLLSVPYALYAANGNTSGNSVGDIQYWDGSKWTILPLGGNGSTLTVCNGSLHWGACSVGYSFPAVTSTWVAAPVLRVPGYAYGNVTSNGGSALTAKGYCWSTLTNPTITNSHATSALGTTDTGSFQTYFTSLYSNTTYYVRAFATNSVGTSYGQQLSFNTGSLSTDSLPLVKTLSATVPYHSGVNHVYPGTGIGVITTNGGNAITEQGICWATSQNPTIANTYSIGTFSSKDTFYSNISNLDSGKTYYIRVYATNGVGTAYGNQISLTIPPPVSVVPTVKTLAVSAPYNRTPGASSGVIVSNGGSPVTAEGLCWSKSPNPTLADSTASGYFVSAIDTFYTTYWNLTSATTYYFRAYATNGVGTSYGNQITLNTASTTTYTLGQSYAGGIIFYLDSTKQHGLVAATSDQSVGIEWWNGSYLTTGATGIAVGNGLTNTTAINKIQARGSYAASIASQPANGYSDWFLPSKDELNLMYKNLFAKGLGSFVGNFYYSSSQYSVNEAWAMDFAHNSQFPYYTNNTARVRAARMF